MATDETSQEAVPGNGSKPVSPERERLVRETHRGYYIAPDSAKPWPNDVFGDIEPAQVETAVAKMNAGMRAAAETSADVPKPRALFVQAQDIALLRTLSGKASQRAAQRFGVA